MPHRLEGQLARLGDAREAQTYSGDTFEWCDEAAYLKDSSTSSGTVSGGCDRRLQSDFAALIAMPTFK